MKGLRRFRPQRGKGGGFSQLELLCAITVMVLATLGFVTGMISSVRLAHAVRERTLATEHARRVIEEMQDATFSQVFAKYGSGTAPGPSFAVEGLTPLADDADGMVGEIQFPTSGAQLREDVVMRTLGMPRDLNGSGTIDAANHAATTSSCRSSCACAGAPRRTDDRRAPHGPVPAMRTILRATARGASRCSSSWSRS